MKNKDFLESVGKTSMFRVDWVSWKRMPKGGEIVVMTGTFCKHFKLVKFDDPILPDIFVEDDENSKRLIAWGYQKPVIRLQKLPKQIMINIPYTS